MKTNKYVSQEFVLAITDEVSKLIAANEYISIKDAKQLFEESRVFNYLGNPPTPFYEEDSDYFF